MKLSIDDGHSVARVSQSFHKFARSPRAFAEVEEIRHCSSSPSWLGVAAQMNAGLSGAIDNCELSTDRNRIRNVTALAWRRGLLEKCDLKRDQRVSTLLRSLR